MNGVIGAINFKMLLKVKYNACCALAFSLIPLRSGLYSRSLTISRYWSQKVCRKKFSVSCLVLENSYCSKLSVQDWISRCSLDTSHLSNISVNSVVSDGL